MIKKGFVIGFILITLTGCGFFKDKTPPPPPEPTIVAVEFIAEGDINPDSQGRPSPLVIRIYQLKYYEAFKNVDYDALYDDDAAVLGNELIAKKEIILQPGQQKTVLLKEVSDDVQTIGFMGHFRSDEAQWRAASGILPNKTTVIRVHVSGTTLISQLQVTQ